MFAFGHLDGALRSRGRQGRSAPLRGASRWSASLTAAFAAGVRLAMAEGEVSRMQRPSPGAPS